MKRCTALLLVVLVAGLFAPEAAGLVDAGVNVIPLSGKTFVGTPSGTLYDIPKGWAPRAAKDAKGIIYQTPGATGNADMIRSIGLQAVSREDELVRTS